MKKYAMGLLVLMGLTACSASGSGQTEMYGTIKGGVETSRTFYLAYIDAINGADCLEALPCIKQIFLATYAINIVLSFLALFASPVVALALTYSIITVWG